LLRAVLSCYALTKPLRRRISSDVFGYCRRARIDTPLEPALSPEKKKARE
jgi:hypothetical protein